MINIIKNKDLKLTKRNLVERRIIMTALSVRLPQSLHKAAKELAKKEQISVNQLITLALAEKIAILDTDNYLGSRAKKGSRKKYLEILKKAPNIKPDEQDKL